MVPVAALLLVASSALLTSTGPGTRIVDLTGDGSPDLLSWDADGVLQIAVPIGGRRFEPVGQTLPAVRDVAGLLVEDLDGDGLLDLYLVGAGRNAALAGDGTGRFRDVTAELGLADAGRALGVERRDVDGDGLPDVLLHNESGDALFWAEPRGGFRRAEVTPADATNAPTAVPAPAATFDDLLATLVASATEPALLGPGVEIVVDTTDDGRPAITFAPAPSFVGGADVPVAPASSTPPAGPLDGTGVGGLTADTDPPFRTTPPNDLLPNLGELDLRYVNDGMLEVDGADVVDGSLAGADVSTTGGDVTHTGGRVGVGTSTPATALHLVDGAGSVGWAGSDLVGGIATVGDPASTSLLIDNNELQARFDTGPTTLYLNSWGGNVHMADGGGDVWIAPNGGDVRLGGGGSTVHLVESGGDVVMAENGGGVAIGTDTPFYDLTVVRSEDGLGAVLANYEGTGPGAAVAANATDPAGIGIFVGHQGSSGNGKAIYSLVESPSGYAGWFQGGRTYFDGKVGIGTPTPAEPLTVYNDAGFLAAGFYSTSQPGTADGIYAETTDDTGKGITGWARATSGNNTGVHALTSSEDGVALWAQGSSPTSRALRVQDGAIQVAGAGVWTPTPVFIAEADASNIFVDGQGRDAAFTIDHPLTNGRPDILLIFSQQLLVASESSTSGDSSALARTSASGYSGNSFTGDMVKFVSAGYSQNLDQWVLAVGYEDEDTIGVELDGRRFHIAVYQP